MKEVYSSWRNDDDLGYVYCIVNKRTCTVEAAENETKIFELSMSRQIRSCIVLISLSLSNGPLKLAYIFSL